MSDLENQVLTSIFVGLPAKSLLRIKSVCKSWYKIINDYHFTKLHFERSNRLYLIISNPVLHLIDIHKLHNPIKLPYPFNDVGDDIIRAAFYQYTRVVGISRGLFCFYMDKSPYTVILYNPTTRTHKLLPSTPRTGSPCEADTKAYVGFGYDPVSDDYKCVKVVHYCKGNNFCKYNPDSFKNLALIYSLKSDCWRTGIHDVPEFFECNGQDCIDINGTLHWSSNDEYLGEKGCPIVTFNLWNQTFDKIIVPSIFRDPRIHAVTYRLGVLDDCLSLVMNYNYSSTEHYFDVHIKKGRFWIRLCKIPILDCVTYRNLKCVYYFKSMGKLLVANNRFDMGYLDINSLKITDLKLPQLIQIGDAYVSSENVLMLKDDDRVLQENPQILQRSQTLLETTLR